MTRPACVRFSGVSRLVIFDLEPNAHENEKPLHEAARRANLAHGAVA